MTSTQTLKDIWGANLPPWWTPIARLRAKRNAENRWVRNGPNQPDKIPYVDAPAKPRTRPCAKADHPEVAAESALLVVTDVDRREATIAQLRHRERAKAAYQCSR